MDMVSFVNAYSLQYVPSEAMCTVLSVFRNIVCPVKEYSQRRSLLSLHIEPIY